jgi:argininosuccinate synthase
MAYEPDKLSMERVEAPPFTPEDRIGALELQNLSVADNRGLLLHYAQTLALPQGVDQQLKGLLGD